MNWIKKSEAGLPKIEEDQQEFIIINSVGSFDIVTFHRDLKDNFGLDDGFYQELPDGFFKNVDDWVEYYYPCEYPNNYP